MALFALADMNLPATTPAPAHQVTLVDVIDFKWLMAGLGHKVHLERLQHDVAYAQDCLVCGARSHVPALRAAAVQLARTMGIALPPSPT